MPLVILEGPDGAGKTTLARRLCETHDMAYVHCGPPRTRVPYMEYYKILSEVNLRATCLDRFHLGEFVYSPLRRNKRVENAHEYTIMELFLMKIKAMCFLVTAPAYVLHKRKREQPFNDIINEAAMFNAMARRSLLNFSVVDTIKLDEFSSLNIMSHLIHNQHVVDDEIMMSDGIGNPVNPSVMFIADRQNKPGEYVFNGNPMENLALNSRCGRYFMEALEMCLRLNDCFIVNSVQLTGKNLDESFLKKINPRVTIALGRDAAKAVAFNVDDEIPHPQWWMRFRFYDIIDYTKLINRVVKRRLGGDKINE